MTVLIPIIPGRTKAEYYIDNKDKIKEYREEYYKNNIDKIKEVINCECGCSVLWFKFKVIS